MFLNRCVLHFCVLVMISSVLTTSIVIAQEPEPLTETYTSRYGSFILQYPADWGVWEYLDKSTLDGIWFYNPEVNDDEDYLQPGAILGVVFDPPQVRLTFPESFSASTILSAITKKAETENDNMFFSDPVETVINGRPVIRADGYDGTKTIVLMTISFNDTDIATLRAWLFGEANPDDSTVLAIVESLQYTPQAVAIDEMDPITAGNASQLEVVAIHPQRNNISAVVFSPDGSMVASGASDEVLVWDVKSGDLVAQLGKEYDEQIGVTAGALTFTDDGTKVVFAEGPFTTVRIWDIETGIEIDTIPSNDTILSIIVDPNNSQIIPEKLIDVSSQLLETAVHDVVIITQNLLENGRRNAEFSIDETLLAIDSGNGIIELWDIENNTMLTSFSGCPRRVFGLALSPDKSLLAAGCFDNTIRLYDVETGKELAVMTNPHYDGTDDLAFDPTGKLLASAGGGKDHRIILWGVPAND